VHYLNVPYPDDNKLLINSNVSLWGDKKEWTKEELISQLKPMCKYFICSWRLCMILFRKVYLLSMILLKRTFLASEVTAKTGLTTTKEAQETGVFERSLFLPFAVDREKESAKPLRGEMPKEASERAFSPSRRQEEERPR